MYQTNFNKKTLIYLGIALIVVLLILAGLLFYFIYFPSKNKNKEIEQKITPESITKAINTPAPKNKRLVSYC